MSICAQSHGMALHGVLHPHLTNVTIMLVLPRSYYLIRNEGKPPSQNQGNSSTSYFENFPDAMHLVFQSAMSHCIKLRSHIVKSDAVCTMYMSSPNHAMPSLIQAGSSTTHTTTSSPQHLRSLRTDVNLHTYLFRVNLCLVNVASLLRHCRVRPTTCSVTAALNLVLRIGTSTIYITWTPHTVVKNRYRTFGNLAFMSALRYGVHLSKLSSRN
ncbi:hypothetical protein F4604DRAFT_257915 [Suillus subluteus]|nr:hypothetical protein F4604DRAFT_257915 [Suillus subluteus]